MRLRRSALLLSALLLLACSAVLLVTGQQQQQPATVDGLTTTTEDASSPPPAAVPSSSSTSMPSTVRAAPAAASPAPAPATPSALAAPIDRTVFRTVAKCSSLVKFPSRRNQTSSSSSQRFFPSVKSLNATLEMDATPSYSSVWRGRDGNDGGWRPGRSRLNVSSLLAQQGSSSAAQGSSSASGGSPVIRVSARLHPLPCLPAGTALFGPLAYSASTAYTHNSEEQGKEGDAPPDGQPAEVLGLKVSSRGKNSSSSSSSSQVAGSATFPFLVDYDSAGSVVLYADGENGGGSGTGVEDGGPTSSSSSPVPLACCSLEPPAPDFPSEWSAVIEANVRDKGYTMVVRQLYSASNKKVRLDVHSLGNDRVVVQDYKRGTATFIDAPNATHPFGSCEVVGFDELAGGADAAASSQFGGGSGSGSGGETSKASAKDSANAAADGSAPVAAGFSSSSSTPKPKQPQQQQQKQQQQEAFLPTAAALAFAPGGGAARARFVPSAAVDVRGIPVETWARRVEEPATNSSFDLLYFFPVNAWLASGEDYHRLLKAIVVNGTQGGQRVYQEFHFVDFRPYGTGSGNAGGGGIGGNASATANGTGIPAEAFDPCEIAPGGAGCGCGPKKKIGAKPAGTADFAAFPAASTASSSSSPRDFSAQRQEQQPQQTMGLLPSQVGSYVFFLFLGLVAGLLGAFGVPALVGCCCRGRRGRSFGRFDEGNGGGAPPTSAVTSAA